MKAKLHFFTALVLISSFLLESYSCNAVSPNIRISQVYGGGGNSGSVYTNDFIELFNASDTPVNLTGWSIQYAPASSSSWISVNLSGCIAAGSYYLIQLYAGGGGTTVLPTADLIYNTLNISATSGKLALVSDTSRLNTDCPSDSSIVDFVGYGTSATCYEGTGPTPAPGNTKSVMRANNGCTDTDENSSDFTSGTPVPRNSASPANLCTFTGISQLRSSSTINIWIHDNRLYVDFSKEKMVNATIEVFNLAGELLSKEKFSGNTIYRMEMKIADQRYIIVRVMNGDKVTWKKLVLL